MKNTDYLTLQPKPPHMICLKVDIPEELSAIDDECKAIYHCKTSVCFYIFKTRELRNAFVEETKGMMKAERMEVYERYQTIEA
ncbi:MAG: hypothetical protein RL642_426 [Bacteroidota bacterium]|jgi:hypothetical protein